MGQEVPGDVNKLVDQLGKAFVNAIMSDKSGHDLMEQIHEAGFEVGLLLEATVALISKKDEDDDGICGIGAGLLVNDRIGKNAPYNAELATQTSLEWSEADKALLGSFRISID